MADGTSSSLYAQRVAASLLSVVGVLCLALAGIAAALAAARLVSGMLFQVSAADPATFAAGTAFLGLVALTASYLSALRATRVDPMRALRCQ